MTKKAALKADPAEEHFSFGVGERSFTSKHLLTDIITPGFVRRNRKAEAIDFYFTILEELFGDQPAAMDELDKSWDLVGMVTSDLEKFMKDKVQISLGE